MRYIRDNKNLGLKYYVDMTDAPVTDLLRQDNIKNENHLMDFYDSSWQYFPDTGRSIGAYIIFYQGGPIDHGTHVPEPVSQSSAESGSWNMCSVVNWPTLIKYNVCSYTSSSVWKISPNRIRKIHQVILSCNTSLYQ